jgi:hypothetical protein
MLSARDDFVLKFLRQVAEVVAVAGHANDKVAMLLWICLGVAEDFSGNNVELHMMATHLEVAPHKVCQAVEPIING